MSIQWFPGHMTAAKNNAEKAMEINDVIVEVLDARIPGSSVNPVIKNIKRVSKPGIRVYSKISDLPKTYGGLGISILSTPMGVMSDNQARQKNVGGEILCEVF